MLDAPIRMLSRDVFKDIHIQVCSMDERAHTVLNHKHPGSVVPNTNPGCGFMLVCGFKLQKPNTVVHLTSS